MCHANNEKWKTTIEGSNRTTKSKKNQNARRKGNLQILENIESKYHQTTRDERKIENKKRTSQENEIMTRNQAK